MNSTKDIISRCHQRHNDPLRQRKTVVTPAIYKGILNHYTVYCAHSLPIRLHDLERANISFMPVGGAPTYDRMPQSYGGDRFLKRQGIESWDIRNWHTSWGIQVYTGMPSELNGSTWHDLEFTYQAICNAPETVLECVDTLVNFVANPLLTITKSGGLRFTCRIENYLHQNTHTDRFYVYQDKVTPENQHQREVYLEILGKEGHSAWDARYEILFGNLLDPPVIEKEVFLAAINTLRQALHQPSSREKTDENLELLPTNIVSPFSLSSQKLDLAKETLLARGFVYLRKEENIHHWTKHNTESSDTDVLLWEHGSNVWIRAANPNSGVPTEDTQITDIWDDTGILPQIPENGLPVSTQIQEIRDRRLTPLVIKRPNQVLEKSEKEEKQTITAADAISQIQHAFENDISIAGINAADTAKRNNYAVETLLLQHSPIILSSQTRILNGATEHFQNQNIPSVIRWRRYRYLWNEVKDIPVATRMKAPFKNGNVCEDAERCGTLKNKGVNPTQTICLQCPVYTTCQQHGYLSQYKILQNANIQLIASPEHFLDPARYGFVEDIIRHSNDSERICIIDDMSTDDLFINCYVGLSTLKKWNNDWEGEPLGNFTRALLNTLQMKGGPDDLLVQRIRTLMHAFLPYQEQITQQMRQVNLNCRILKERTIDEKDKTVLAQYKIVFENDVTAHIPINDAAADRLRALERTVLPIDIEHYTPNKDIKVQIPIEQAIRLGILDISTPEKIYDIPTTYQNPEWTLWHQLKRFFAHYARNTDAPMMWYNNCLNFWVPPILHPNIKKLLVISPTVSEHDLQRVFQNEKIKVEKIKPTPWAEGTQVFQIRTGIHWIKTMLDHDTTWDVLGLTNIGKRFMQGICAEIQRSKNTKHAIISYQPIIDQLNDLTSEDNMCVAMTFENAARLETFDTDIQVLWLVGTPSWQPNLTWRHAQILYGNDEKPLSYDTDIHFQQHKDPRLQHVYLQRITHSITDILGKIGLSHLPNKKVVLINSIQIPNITDRPETLLFDWEDFEIAGNLDKLAETIAIRQKFETERANLTADCSREKVERIVGCSSRQANRILQQLRGGNIPHITYREQILSLLTEGEKKASDITEAIEGNPTSINNELARLLKIGEIIKVRWGVYTLPNE